MPRCVCVERRLEYIKFYVQKYIKHLAASSGPPAGSCRVARGARICENRLLAGITLLWFVGLNIDWDCLVPHCIMGSCDQWEFLDPSDSPLA